MERADELKERIRQQPLNDRLEESRRRIGDMCSKGRCPKMTIPVQHDDDDFYINTTLADAQATIAALQARVKELEQWVQDQSTANLETMRHTDEMQSRAMEAEQQLTQRTAELEAANHSAQAFQTLWRESCNQRDDLQAKLERVRGEVDVWKEKAELRGKEACAQRAELERVRGELAETSLYLQQERANRDSLAACVDRDVKTIKKLRTLVLALPKVEGEIVIWEVGTYHRVHYCTSDGSVVILARFKTREDANKYAALLKHRQGMEG